MKTASYLILFFVVCFAVLLFLRKRTKHSMITLQLFLRKLKITLQLILMMGCHTYLGIRIVCTCLIIKFLIIFTCTFYHFCWFIEIITYSYIASLPVSLPSMPLFSGSDGHYNYNTVPTSPNNSSHGSEASASSFEEYEFDPACEMDKCEYASETEMIEVFVFDTTTRMLDTPPESPRSVFIFCVHRV